MGRRLAALADRGSRPNGARMSHIKTSQVCALERKVARSGGQSNRPAAGHRQVADIMGRRLAAVADRGSRPNEARVSYTKT